MMTPFQSHVYQLVQKATTPTDRHQVYQLLNQADRGFPSQLFEVSVEGFSSQLFSLVCDYQMSDEDIASDVPISIPSIPPGFKHKIESNTLTSDDLRDIMIRSYWDILELDPLPIHQQLIQAAYQHNNLIAIVLLESRQRSDNPRELLQYLNSNKKYQLFRWYHSDFQTFKGLSEAFQLLPPIQTILLDYMGDSVNLQQVIPMHRQIRDYFGNQIPTAGPFADKPTFTGDLCRLEAPLDHLNTTVEQKHILLKDHAKTYCVKLAEDEPVYYIDEDHVLYYLPEYHYKNGKHLYKSDIAKILASPGGELKESVLRTMFYVHF